MVSYLCLICSVIFLSETHSCNELRTRSHRYALQNFEEVVKTEEFLFLSFSEVIDLQPFVCAPPEREIKNV